MFSKKMNLIKDWARVARAMVLGGALCLAASHSHAQIDVAGNLLVDIDATDASAGTATWTNNGTLGDFNFVTAIPAGSSGGLVGLGTPDDVVTTVVQGVISVYVDSASDAMLAYQGPGSTAGITGNSARSVEAWVLNPNTGDFHENIVCWGRRGGPDGSAFSFGYGAANDFGAAIHWSDNFDTPWNTVFKGDDSTSVLPTTGTWHHVVYTYDGAQNIRLYNDGQLVVTRGLGAPMSTHLNDINSNPHTINLWVQNNNNLGGLSNNSLPSMYFNAIRVHDGQLSDAQVLNNFNEGPYGGFDNGGGGSITADVTNNAATWPEAPEAQSADVLTLDTALAGRGLVDPRELRQSFECTTDFTVERIYLAWNGYTGSSFSVKIYEIDDIEADTWAPGSQVGGTITVNPGTANPDDGNLELTLSEGIALTARTSPAGYGIEVATINGEAMGQIRHSNSGTDHAPGAFYTESGGRSGGSGSARDWGVALTIGAPPCPEIPPMVAYWPLDDGTGSSVASDEAGGNDGILVGLDPNTAWITGKLGGAIQFDNIDGHHIEVAHSAALDFGDVDFSISMLIRYDEAPVSTDRWLIKGTHGAPGTGNRYEMFYTGGTGTTADGRNIRFSIDNDTNGKSRLQSSPATDPVVTGDWVHMVFVRDATNDLLSIYADGVLLESTDPGGIADNGTDISGDISSGEPLWIGESTDEADTAMSGAMDDIRIFGVALTEQDIANIAEFHDGCGEDTGDTPNKAESWLIYR